MSTPSTLHSARGRLAVAVRDGRTADAALARQDLAAARIERAIRTDLDGLRDEQRHALAVLILPGALA